MDLETLLTKQWKIPRSFPSKVGSTKQACPGSPVRLLYTWKAG